MIRVALERETEKKEQCSPASGMTEWHFYDVSQIIPWDGWAELEHQLINPSTGGMCCSRPPAQLFFPWTEHSDRHAGEEWLISGATADTVHVCLCMCAVPKMLACVWLIE